MKKLCCLLCALLLCLPPVSSLAANGKFVKHAKRDAPSGILIQYYVYMPNELSPGMPLVVYLHGSGESGEGAILSSLPYYIRKGSVLSPHTIVVVPQLPLDFGQWNMIGNTIVDIVDSVVSDLEIDETRIALAGFSLGAIGAWDITNLRPGRFSRVLSISGRVNDDVYIDSFEGCQVKTYYGSRDTNINPETAIAFTRALIHAGYDAELIQLDAYHNNMPNKVFQDPDLLQWLWMELPPKDEKK